MVDLGSVLEVALDVGEDVPEEEEGGGGSESATRARSVKKASPRTACSSERSPGC